MAFIPNDTQRQPRDFTSHIANYKIEEACGGLGVDVSDASLPEWSPYPCRHLMDPVIGTLGESGPNCYLASHPPSGSRNKDSPRHAKPKYGIPNWHPTEVRIIATGRSRQGKMLVKRGVWPRRPINHVGKRTHETSRHSQISISNTPIGGHMDPKMWQTGKFWFADSAATIPCQPYTKDFSLTKSMGTTRRQGIGNNQLKNRWRRHSCRHWVVEQVHKDTTWPESVAT